ncbi:MAG: queuosine precursor transporter [Thermanaerothrix sp.]|nr:queuosine precursor transporter [Thermanaerothrix sp.]
MVGFFIPSGGEAVCRYNTPRRSFLCYPPYQNKEFLMQSSPQQRNGISSYRYLDLVMAYFVAVLIISNVASSAKIVDLGFSLFGVPMAFDGGTLLFPLSYIFGDILTEVYGFRASRRVIWTGFFCLALASLIFFVLKRLPADATWEGYAGSAAYDAILGGMSSGGIALASLAGYWAGEFSNSAVLSRMKVLMQGRHLWMRTIGSTLVGELVDTTVFVLVASLFNVFGWELFITLVLTNYLFKCGVEILMTPATYKIVAFLKKKEQVDTYDVGVKLNPFSFAQK